MGSMDADTRQNPALHLTGSVEPGKQLFKREDPEYHANRSGSAHGPSSTAAMGSNPSSPYQSAPPQAYRYRPTYGSDRSSFSGPSHTSEPPSHHVDERIHLHDHPPPSTSASSTRQSLPSIKEALGTDQPISQFTPTHIPTSQSNPSPPPPEPLRNLQSDSHSREPYHPPRYAPQSPPMGHAAPQMHISQAHHQPGLSSTSSLPEQRLPGVQHLTGPHSPQQAPSHSYATHGPQRASPEYGQAQPVSQPPFQSYSYAPYSSQMYRSAPADTTGKRSYPQGHLPTSQDAVWSSSQSELPGAEAKAIGRPPYGESVKRHLDGFDLESALNDVSESSKHLFEFSTHYSQRAHQTHRSGPLPGSTPNLSEIEEMMKHGSRIQDSLVRLRDVVLSQQAALAERSKDQAIKGANGYGAEDAQLDSAKGGGFAGSDPKKRRGRAAPPGRCHSCNRAETPEWRRGPDGARTLCNACGLHYAKLTRKMGTSKASAIGSSNLRPKSIGSSPTS